MGKDQGFLATRVGPGRWSQRFDEVNQLPAEVPEACTPPAGRGGLPHWSIAGIALCWHGHKKQRPRLFNRGRLGSPPPELPNYEMDIRVLPILCKRHLGNSSSAELRKV